MAEQKNAVILKSVRAEELRFTNRVEGGQVQIRFEHKYSYSVK